VSFVADPDNDIKVLEEIQSRFEVKVDPLPEKIELSSYMNA
jgi:hypothetical protein